MQQPQILVFNLVSDDTRTYIIEAQQFIVALLKKSVSYMVFNLYHRMTIWATVMATKLRAPSPIRNR